MSVKSWRKVWLISCFITLATGAIAPVASGQGLSQHQQQFIHHLLPAIRQQNDRIRAQRQRLQVLFQQWRRQPLTPGKRKVVVDVANRYQVSTPKRLTDAFWQRIFNRVDTMPASLVLAQAINESGWGQSRFARDGNNFFGIWCYQRGCGIVPKRRAPNKTHEVKRFASVDASVNGYIHNLNTNPAYQELRDIRARQHQKQQALHGYQLAEGLAHYSEKKQLYVVLIRYIIGKYDLAKFDRKPSAFDKS